MSETLTTTDTKPAREALERGIAAATDALLARQKNDGHWVFELEADATIPAEYVLLRHYLGEPVDAELERKIAVYLRRIQGTHGGWPLFHDGAFDMSASVKAYFALKMIGDDIDAPHMKLARDTIRARGGAEESNVFTRVLLSLFGVTTWRAVPVMPVPPVEGVVLGPHRDRAAAGVAGAETQGAKPQGHRHRRIVPSAAAHRRPED